MTTPTPYNQSMKPTGTVLIDVPTKYWGAMAVAVIDAGLALEQRKQAACTAIEVGCDGIAETPVAMATVSVVTYYNLGTKFQMEVPAAIKKHVTKIKDDVITGAQSGRMF